MTTEQKIIHSFIINFADRAEFDTNFRIAVAKFSEWDDDTPREIIARLLREKAWQQLYDIFFTTSGTEDLLEWIYDQAK